MPDFSKVQQGLCRGVQLPSAINQSPRNLRRDKWKNHLYLYWWISNKNSYWFRHRLNKNYLLELNSMKLLIAYIFLLAGIFLGILANGYFLKMSGGFTKLFPSIACGIIILLAVFCLSRAMNTIPVGFTYATYGGLTIIGVTLFGIVKYSQTPNIYGSIGIILIVLGVVFVNYLGKINS